MSLKNSTSRRVCVATCRFMRGRFAPNINSLLPSTAGRDFRASLPLGNDHGFREAFFYTNPTVTKIVSHCLPVLHQSDNWRRSLCALCSQPTKLAFPPFSLVHKRKGITWAKEAKFCNRPTACRLPITLPD